uniref:Pharynx and intestine in excess protein 1 n=1 Tax=Lygus hesperus TaxID=30085 RepID=A0A0A9WIB6_LYGHE
MASLVADYGESSSADSSDDSESENFEKHEESTTNARLPPPTFTDKIKNSVFVNPFLEAENAKLTVLEKHVKMVPQTNGKEHKKICWMFKKGNCRFGKKCKFLHDDTSTAAVTTPAGGTTDSKDTTNYVQNQEALGDDPDERGSDDDEPLKKKKRPGLTRGLIPGKKVMAMYRKQKAFSH